MRLTIEDIPEILSRFVGADTLDLTGLTWIEPVGLSIIKTIKETKHVDIVLPLNKDILMYLNVMNFHEDAEQLQGRTYVPLHMISSARDIDLTAKKTAEKILLNDDFSGLSHKDANDFRQYLEYTIAEMLNNAIEHSSFEDQVVACAQYLPKSKKTQIAIVDTGVGFHKTLSRKYPVTNEMEALKLALQKGVTGALTMPYENTQRHAGYGLYILSQMILNMDGLLLIVSNNGMLVLKNGTVTVSSLNTPWHGSIIAFEIDERKINYSLAEFLRIFIWPDEKTEPAEEIY